MTVIQELLSGVRTGTDDAVPASEAWPRVPEGEAIEELEYLCCEGNWSSAEKEPALVEKLLED